MTTQFNQGKPQAYDPNFTPLIRDTKILNLSTQSSSGYLLNGDYKSKAYYELKNFIDYENDDSVEYISVSMPYVVLCNSNYIINETNNTLNILPQSANLQTYTFPQGNYTATSFMATWKTLIPSNYVITFNQLTNKFTIKNTATIASAFTLSGNIDYIMGFSGSVSSVFISNVATLNMPRSCNFLPLPRFNICCDFLNNGTLLSNNSSFGNSIILASVPNNSKNNNLIVYESDANEFILKTLTLNTLTISIQDDNGNLINFNGVSSYFQLRFSIFRKRIPKLLPFKQIVDLANTQDIFSEETEGLIYS